MNTYNFPAAGDRIEVIHIVQATWFTASVVSKPVKTRDRICPVEVEQLQARAAATASTLPEADIFSH